MKLVVPSKTFILGEYLALKGGQSLVLAMDPCFEAVFSDGNFDLCGVHPQSPAGKLVADYRSEFQNTQIRFLDAHQGQGGFGASTAQFLSVYRYLLEQKKKHLKDLHSCYLDYAWDGQGLAPSGADLIAQNQGGLSLFSNVTLAQESLKWPFDELEIYLFSTGTKLATHEHLKDLAGFSEQGLRHAMDQALLGIQTDNSDIFIEAFKKYAVELSRLGFVARHTLELLHDLSWVPGVFAAKGCGAMGSDVIAVLGSPNLNKDLQLYLADKNLGPLWTTKNIRRGAQWEN